MFPNLHSAVQDDALRLLIFHCKKVSRHCKSRRKATQLHIKSTANYLTRHTSLLLLENCVESLWLNYEVGLGEKKCCTGGGGADEEMWCFFWHAGFHSFISSIKGHSRGHADRLRESHSGRLTGGTSGQMSGFQPPAPGKSRRSKIVTLCLPRVVNETVRAM